MKRPKVIREVFSENGNKVCCIANNLFVYKRKVMVYGRFDCSLGVYVEQPKIRYEIRGTFNTDAQVFQFRHPYQGRKGPAAIKRVECEDGILFWTNEVVKKGRRIEVGDDYAWAITTANKMRLDIFLDETLSD